MNAKESELSRILGNMDLPIGRTEKLTSFNLLWILRNIAVRNSEVQGFDRAKLLMKELISERQL